MMIDRVVLKRRAAAIKAARMLQPYPMELGEAYVLVYIETLTEGVKQSSRELRKLARDIDQRQLDLFEAPGREYDETEKIREVCTQITTACQNVYEASYINFPQYEEEQVDKILDDEDEDSDT